MNGQKTFSLVRPAAALLVSQIVYNKSRDGDQGNTNFQKRGQSSAEKRVCLQSQHNKVEMAPTLLSPLSKNAALCEPYLRVPPNGDSVAINKDTINWLDSSCLNTARNKGSSENSNLLEVKVEFTVTAESKIKEYLVSDVFKAQLEAFHNGQEWNEVKASVTNDLFQKYFSLINLLVDSDCVTFVDNLKRLIDEAVYSPVPYTLHEGSGRFPKRAWKGRKVENPHTEIRGVLGNRFKVLTRVSQKESRDIGKELGTHVEPGKVLIAEGASGTVRYIHSENDDRLGVVKKITSDPYEFGFVEREIDFLMKVRGSERVVQLWDFAHIPAEDDKIKSYLCMEYAGQMEGADMLEMIARIEDEQRRDSLIDQLALQYALAVSELHDYGIYHLDLKLLNFFHYYQDGLWTVKLGDLGTSTDKLHEFIEAGTDGFYPPEFLHCIKSCRRLGVKLENGMNRVELNNSKRDAWAFGICLLALKSLDEMDWEQPCMLDIHRECRSGNPVAQRLKLEFDDGECVGVAHTRDIRGDTLDGVIAKFLAKDPRERISIQEALELPYFTQLLVRNSDEEIQN